MQTERGRASYRGCDVPGCANYLRRLGIDGEPNYRWDPTAGIVRRLARCGHPELAGEPAELERWMLADRWAAAYGYLAVAAGARGFVAVDTSGERWIPWDRAAADVRELEARRRMAEYMAEVGEVE